MDMSDHGHHTPSTPQAPPIQTIDICTLRPIHRSNDVPAPPSGPQPAPTGLSLQPVTPSNPRVGPGNE